MNPAVFMAMVLGALAGLMAGARALQAGGRVAPETARKIVHIGMGVVSLFLPWIFVGAGPVWMLALLSAAGLVGVRLIPGAMRRLGGVLYGVGRFSLGEIYFPLGVALAFTLARENRAAFCGAVGVLAFADSAGAMVGSRWGRRRYALRGHVKSIEGSAAVLVTSILWTTLSLAVLGGGSWMSAVAGGLLIGAAATVIEAVAGHGLDNLLLPLAVVGLMKVWGNEAADFQVVRMLCGGAAVMAFAVFAVSAVVSARQPPPPTGATPSR